MVTSQKMIENEMEYRGSKSEIKSPQPKEISVNEQRVDGSYFGLNKSKLRCILMGCESSYQLKIPSKQLYSRSYYSTLVTIAQEPVLSKINPWFISAASHFTDAPLREKVVLLLKHNIILI